MKSASASVTNARCKMDPLFEYSNIQPPVVYVDDDDEEDEELQVLERAQCHPTTDEKVSVREKRDRERNTEAVNADADWLEVFPPVSTGQRVISTDPTLLKIRQQKEELLKIWQASEASMKDMEESAKKGARVPDPFSREQDADEPPSKRQKILLKLQGPAGDKHGFKVFADDQFEKLFMRYANDAKRPLAEFVFCFDGQQLSPSSCPKDVDLEDEDIVEVYEKRSRHGRKR